MQKNLSFMFNKKQNEELQSRREFFKKAAKAALPVVGAMVMSSIPFVKAGAAYCSGCQNDCTNGCRGGCHRSCGSSCALNCKGSSSMNYSGPCDGCKYACGGCKGYCSGSCSGSCSVTSYTV